MKKSMLLVPALVLSLMLTACGNGTTDSGNSGANSGNSGSSTETKADNTGSNSGSSAKALSVNIWDNNQLAGLQKIADEWTAESGIPVNINVVEWDSYWTLLEAGASGGEIPDVFWMHSNTAQMYMENEILLDLDDYIAADDSINLDDYYPGITELYSSGGKQYALPKDHDTIALLYNQEIFDRYNVEAPTDDWSWDDVYEAAAKITEAGKADGIYGYAADTSNDQDFWYNLVYGYGGFIVDTDHKTVGIASDASKAGMEMVRKIISVSTPQTIVTETGTDSLFQSNLCAMITQGSWMINAFYTAEGAANYKWVEIPYSDVNGNGTCDDGERVSCYNGLGWAAAANTDNPDAAYSLISYFCSKEGQTKQAELGITMAGMPGVSDAFAGAFEGMDVSAFIKVEENGTLFFRPYSRNSIAWSQPITQAGALLDAWQNPTDPAAMSTACDNAARIMEQAIANE
jgi:multiple sugar transport system substrate-binding protein